MVIRPSKLNELNPAPIMQHPVVCLGETDQLIQHQHYNHSAEKSNGREMPLTSYSVNRRVAQ